MPQVIEQSLFLFLRKMFCCAVDRISHVRPDLIAAHHVSSRQKAEIRNELLRHDKCARAKKITFVFSRIAS